MSPMTDILLKAANDISVDLSSEELDAFDKYAELLREWNEVMNLTNITDDEGMAIRHFADSLTVVPYIEAEQTKKKKNNLSIIDVGTGAGFPGIPLKIKKSELELTLMDALNKRLNFLRTVIEQVGLQNVKIQHSRAEDGGRDKKLREKYDIATARAVAALPVLCEYCLPFVKVGGLFIAMKGHSEDEIKQSKHALEVLGGKIEKIDNFCLPGTDMTRSIITVRKIKPTPAGFPRQAGKPTKSPL